MLSPVTLMNPYQKLGTEVPRGMSPLAALELAGMTGWNQRLAVPVVDGGAYPAGKHRMIVADLPTGPAVLGAVLDSYRPIQVEEAFVPVLDGFADGGMMPRYVGAYDNGRACYIQFDLPSGGDLLGDGTIHTGVTLTKRNDGGGAIRAYPTTTRVACANMLNWLAQKNKAAVTVRHTRNADPHVAATVERLLGLTTDWDAEMRAEIAALEAVEVTRRQYIDQIVPVLVGPEPEEIGRSLTIWTRKRAELVGAWAHPTNPGGDTAWNAYNAVTVWEQHERQGTDERKALAVLHGSQPMTERLLELVRA